MQAMGSFPAVCRPHIRAELSSVLRLVMGAPKKTQDQRTLRTRRTHFLRWATIRGVFPLMFPVVQTNLPTISLNYIMGMYAIFLASGHTISHKQIRAKTIHKYLLAASSFIQLFDPIPNRDARKNPDNTTFSPPVKTVMAQVEKHEKIPDKREPYTLEMQRSLIDTAKNTHQDSLLRATSEWFAVALQQGNRQGEWCQDRSHRHPHSYRLNRAGQSMAFTLGDFQFLGDTGNHLTLTEALGNRKKVKHAIITYRFQKNGRNGEKKKVTRNTTNPSACSVTNLLNICDRGVRLLGPTATDRPLAVFRAKDGKLYHITADDANKIMRATAKIVYNSTPAEQTKWTTHSLRVGACCILWAQHKSPEFIQNALRWRSESWKDYIRDLLIHSHEHNDSINSEWNRHGPLTIS